MCILNFYFLSSFKVVFCPWASVFHSHRAIRSLVWTFCIFSDWRIFWILCFKYAFKVKEPRFTGSFVILDQWDWLLWKKKRQIMDPHEELEDSSVWHRDMSGRGSWKYLVICFNSLLLNIYNNLSHIEKSSFPVDLYQEWGKSSFPVRGSKRGK